MSNNLSFTGGTKLRNSLFIALLLALSGISHTGLAQSGLAAFNAGQYNKALQLWHRELINTPDSPQIHYNLALLFDKGLGINADASQATRHYLKAADQNYAPAMFNLGVIMAKKNNYQAAAKWWLRASKSDLPEAQYNLAKLYAQGQGVEKNLEQAKYWFKQAARSAMSKFNSLNGIINP